MKRHLTLATILGSFLMALVPGVADAACNLKYADGGGADGTADECAGGTPGAGSAFLGLGAIVAAPGGPVAGYRRGKMDSIGRGLGGIYHGNRAAARDYKPVINRVNLPKSFRHEIYQRQPRAANGADFICAVTTKQDHFRPDPVSTQSAPRPGPA